MILGGGSLSPVTHNMSLPRLSVSLKRSNPPHLALLTHLKNSEKSHTRIVRDSFEAQRVVESKVALETH